MLKRIGLSVVGLAAFVALSWSLVGANSRTVVTAWIRERLPFDSPPTDAMVIGNSMAPAIRGSRYQLGCPDCNWDTEVAIESFDPTLLFCGNCGRRLEANFSDSSVDRSLWLGSGRKAVAIEANHSARPIALLAGDSTQLQIGTPPKRWDCVLVREPNDPMRAVKRLVGLPGEVVEVREGDLYINGKVSPRSPLQILSMSRFVHDARYAPATGDRWKETENGGGWLREKWPWRMDRKEASPDGIVPQEVHSKSSLAWLVYHHDEPWPLQFPAVSPVDSAPLPSQGGSLSARERPITDWMALNSNFSGTLYRCHDLVLRVDLRLAKLSRADGNASAVSPRVRFEVAVLVRDSQLRLPVILDDDFVTSPLLGERWEHRGRPFTLYFLACDRQVGLAVKDSTRPPSEMLQGSMQDASAFVESERDSSPMLRAPTPIAIGVGSDRVLVERLVLGKDIYYRPSALRGMKEGDPVDGYLLLGDNTQISSDSSSNLRWIRGVPEGWVEGVVRWESASWWR